MQGEKCKILDTEQEKITGIPLYDHSDQQKIN